MSRKLLLDTHVLLWALSKPNRIPAAVRKEIDRSETWASAASIWEIAIKHALGRMQSGPDVVLAGALELGVEMLDVTGAHAVRSADLTATLHKDPFDRLLVAQALCETMTLLTHDAALARFAPAVRLIA